MNSTYKIFVTFGDGSKKIKASARRISAQAEKFFFNKIIVANLEYLKINCEKEYKNNIKFISKNKKGLGFWIWKPILIQHVLKTSPENSIIFYADCGCEFSSSGHSSLEYYFKEASKKNSIFFKLPYHEAEWTKADLLSHKRVNLRNADNFNQIQSTFFFLKNIKKNRDLVKEWYEISCESNYHYLDDTPSIINNHSDFKAHRHDQSILSCLVHVRKISKKDLIAYYFNPYYVSFTNSPFRRYFIHSFRNLSGKSFLENNNLKKHPFKIYLEIIYLLIKMKFIARSFISKKKLLRQLIFKSYNS